MPTATSPKPTTTIRGLPRALARQLEAYADRLDVDQIKKAYGVAVEAHVGQRRASGDPYVKHAVEVATILGSLHLDTATIVAGLVHDAIEDTAVSLPDLRSLFGDEIADLVDGVTKIGKVEFRSSTEHQMENYRKLLLSMADDARVILIKLADRLHNMRTLGHLPQGKQKRIALETREIYAPLAHRLGIAHVRWELEDLAFKFLEPPEYDALRKKIQQRRRERERQVLEMQRPIEEELAAAGIPVEVTGRPKHLWSIFKKMERRAKPYEEIYDLMAMRVTTDSVQNCYAALGVIHSLWTPIQERFHDYIATPKSNMYRSIHTTIFGPSGRRYEIQIRTEEMHRTAEYGIASHWRYKEGKEGKANDVDDALTWFRQVLEGQKDTREPEEFMEFLRMDLFQGEMFVFTPKGEVRQLPVGATPIDFAFAVHTEVGLHCAGARVNGRIAPLSRELKNGDTIEILTNPKQWPSRDWLAFVKTSRARGRIKQWVRKQEYDSAVELGRDFLDREIKKVRLVLPLPAALESAASSLGYADFQHVHAALGRGDVGFTAILKALFPDHDPDAEPRPPTPLERLAEKLRMSGKGVRIQGMENMMVRYSQCCQPVPGDNVIGYITRGRGVSIHRGDCPNILTLDRYRRIEIEWKAEKGDRFMVKLFLRGGDRRGLLSDIAKAISDTGTNIQHADMRSVDGGMNGVFIVEVQDLSRLRKVVKAVGTVKGVISVERRESFEEADLVKG